MRSILVFVALFGLAGCGGSSSTPESSDEIVPTPTTQSLPTGCAPTGALFGCDPVTNAGCSDADNQECDSNLDGGFACYPPPNTVPLGGACNDQVGPSCMGGYACNTPDGDPDGVCAKYCCSPADCGDAGTSCVAFDSTFGSLGFCQ